MFLLYTAPYHLPLVMHQPISLLILYIQEMPYMVYYITNCDKKPYDTNKYNYTLKTEGYKRYKDHTAS